MKFWIGVLIVILSLAIVMLGFTMGFSPMDEANRHGARIALAFMVGALMIVWMFRWNWS